jgi:hypothetical protein
MMFCHLAKATSLRDIQYGLLSAEANLYHLGIDKAPARATLAYNNEKRSYKVFEELYYRLLHRYGSQLGMSSRRLLDRKVYMLDSTTISLCLSLFDWARFRQRKGAIKLHTLLDYDGCLPVYMHLSDGKMHDARIAKHISLSPDAVLVADRAYLDYANLYRLHSEQVHFVTRTKTNMNYQVIEDINLDSSEAQDVQVLADYKITLPAAQHGKYPEDLRVVCLRDLNTNQQVELLTNNMSWTAQEVGKLYKARWSIEIFFKMLKQHLRIKTFIGTSRNAVLIQVYTAMICILLLKLLKIQAKHKWQMGNMIAMIRVQLLAKIDLKRWLDDPFAQPHNQTNQYGQLRLNLSG